MGSLPPFFLGPVEWQGRIFLDYLTKSEIIFGDRIGFGLGTKTLARNTPALVRRNKKLLDDTLNDLRKAGLK
jgi:hypothetical protein